VQPNDEYLATWRVDGEASSVRLLVVGGTGLLGSAVVERARVATPASRETGYGFFDDDPVALVADHDPDAVVLAATVEQADVPLAEYTTALDAFVDACWDRRLVYVSSDAVFDGEHGGYRPDDERSPRDQYGRRLVAFEDAVADHPDAVVLRPSYVYSGVPLSPRLAAARDALETGSYERFDDMYRSPAHATDVAAAVCELAVGTQMGVFHVPGPRLSVYEFHRRALDALGVDTDDLRATSIPDGTSVARDRSLVGPRFDAELDVDVRPPADAL
jgi:dTDP-4-dehydrorhamnose reductase